MSNRNIERVFNVAVHNLYTIDGSMDYSRITETITRLSNLITDSETDESTWWMGGDSYVGLADLIAGAYWHFTEWHAGQSSQGYEALCALGEVFNPGMSGLDEDNFSEKETYDLLNDMAKETEK